MHSINSDIHGKHRSASMENSLVLFVGYVKCSLLGQLEAFFIGVVGIQVQLFGIVEEGMRSDSDLRPLVPADH